MALYTKFLVHNINSFSLPMVHKNAKILHLTILNVVVSTHHGMDNISTEVEIALTLNAFITLIQQNGVNKFWRRSLLCPPGNSITTNFMYAMWLTK